LSKSTLLKKLSYFSLFLEAASLTIKLKVYWSSPHIIQSVSAIIVAALGQLYKRANSPKLSPGIYVFKNAGFSPYLNTFSHLASPSSKIYKELPSSPYLIMNSPFLYFFSSIASITIFLSFSSRAENIKDYIILLKILSFYSYLLVITLG